MFEIASIIKNQKKRNKSLKYALLLSSKHFEYATYLSNKQNPTDRLVFLVKSLTIW